MLENIIMAELCTARKSEDKDETLSIYRCLGISWRGFHLYLKQKTDPEYFNPWWSWTCVGSCCTLLIL